MGDVKWIKITTDMFEHEKLDFILSLPEADAIVIVWIRLLTLAGKVNAGGYVLLTENIAYTEEMLAHKFRKSPSVIKLALETLKRLKMIELDGETLRIANWDKHQNVDGMERIREQNRLRKQKERASKKLLEPPKSDDSHVTVTGQVTQSHATEIDLDLEIDIDKENNIKHLVENDEKIIFAYWNSKGIMKHRELTAAMKSKIHARLTNLTTDEIKQAIDNYKTVISDNETYWYSHKFTLADFMNPKNLDRFLTENDPLNNHKRKNNTIPFRGGNTNAQHGTGHAGRTDDELDAMSF